MVNAYIEVDSDTGLWKKGTLNNSELMKKVNDELNSNTSYSII